MTLEYRRQLSTRPRHWADTFMSTCDTLLVDPSFFCSMVLGKISLSFPIYIEIIQEIPLSAADSGWIWQNFHM